MRVLIITGGSSSERKISLISAGEVKKALRGNGNLVQIFDFRKGYSALKKMLPKFDVIFPVLHGEEGEGGGLQKFLIQENKPFVGSSYQGLQKGWHKIPFKEFCDREKIPGAPWKKISRVEEIIKFGFPSVLKSSNGGSSKEVVILKSDHDLKSKVCKNLLQSSLPLFVEKFLPGIEVTVGILDNTALPVLEIIPPDGKWFDYKNKYSGKTQEIINAPSLSPAQRRSVQQTALKIHQTLDLGPYSRIDFIMTSARLHPRGGILTAYALEVNTIPGLTSQSLFPKAALAAGISFENLVEKLVRLSFEN